MPTTVRLIYFRTARTEDEAAQIYRKHAMKLHPDAGGSTEQFQALRQEYTEWQTLFKHGFFGATPPSPPPKKSRTTSKPKQPKTAPREQKPSKGLAKRKKGASVPPAPSVTPIATPDMRAYVNEALHRAEAICKGLSAVVKAFDALDDDEYEPPPGRFRRDHAKRT